MRSSVVTSVYRQCIDQKGTVALVMQYIPRYGGSGLVHRLVKVQLLHCIYMYHESPSNVNIEWGGCPTMVCSHALIE